MYIILISNICISFWGSAPPGPPSGYVPAVTQKFVVIYYFFLNIEISDSITREQLNQSP